MVNRSDMGYLANNDTSIEDYYRALVESDANRSWTALLSPQRLCQMAYSP